MVRYKSVQTIRTTKLLEETVVKGTAPFSIGDWVEVYNGSEEGHCFRIADIRWNKDIGAFEYYRDDGPFWCTWYRDGQVVESRSPTGRRNKAARP